MNPAVELLKNGPAPRRIVVADVDNHIAGYGEQAVTEAVESGEITVDEKGICHCQNE